ncbi:MAG: hypothetical protein POELPBGB_02444 [Bacteroidia bacterium]|nr:hypothetical protein [Bacteroidia bacterium]
MNKLNHLFMLLLMPAVLFSITSCNPNDDDDPVDVRDAVLSWSATGACTQTENVTFTDNETAGTVNISLATYNSAGQLLSIVFFETGYSWQLGISVEQMGQLQTGTYQLPVGGGALINGTISSNCATGFTIVSGELNITAVDDASDVGNPGDKYISGTLTLTLQDGNNPPATIDIDATITNLFIATS